MSRKPVEEVAWNKEFTLRGVLEPEVPEPTVKERAEDARSGAVPE